MRKSLFFFLIPSASNGFADSMYSLAFEKDIVIAFTSLSLAATLFFLQNNINTFSSDDLPLQKGVITAFDRSLMFEYNKSLDITSYVLLYGLLAMPVISLAGNIKDSKVWLTYGVMFAESVLFVFGTSELLKNVTTRFRPYCYFNDAPPGRETDYNKSFFSEHTAFAFMMAGFLTATFFTEYPDSPWKMPVAAASYSLAAGVGTTRIISGSHFLSDILAGAALGSLFGYIVPWLHLMNKSLQVLNR